MRLRPSESMQGEQQENRNTFTGDVDAEGMRLRMMTSNSDGLSFYILIRIHENTATQI